jgi:hypothetical protein
MNLKLEHRILATRLSVLQRYWTYFVLDIAALVPCHLTPERNFFFLCQSILLGPPIDFTYFSSVAFL